MTPILAAALLALGLAGPAFAFGDPDWPCEQRKVVTLSIGQMWNGPLPAAPEAWRDDPALAGAVAAISARRTSLEQVGPLLDQIAAQPDAAVRLPLLFQGVFDTVGAERARIIDGIVRFVRKQRDLSARIDAEQVELARLEAETKPDDFDGLDRIDALRDKLLWDVRIYEDRRRSLRYVCESPVILEQRLFAVGRLVQARLPEG